MSHHIQPCTGKHGLHPCMYDSGWEGIKHFTPLGGDDFFIFSGIQYSSSNLVIFQCGSCLPDQQKVGYTGGDPGCNQHIHLTPFYHIHDAAYCGGSRDHRNLSHEAGQVQGYEGYLILIIALDYIYLNLYDDIANRSSQGVSQVCTPCPPRSERGPISREWFSMSPGIMVLILAPLSKRAMHLSPLISTLATFSVPYHWLKGLGFKKAVCVWHFTPGVSHPWTPSAWSPFLEGLRLPSLVLSPLSGLETSLL